jgi:probable rRNA maturation factor
MTVAIEVEDETWTQQLPGLEGLADRTVKAALSACGQSDAATDVFVLFTDDIAIAAMNAEWRGKPKPTNVLSFPAPDGMPLPEGEPKPLGDIVLASGVVTAEARDQGKTLQDHCTHLIVHGCLHLLGHDHEDEAEAAEMEQLEIDILKGLGISNPYERQ